MQDFYSIKEFALEVRVHPNTIRRAIKAGKISAFRPGPSPKGSYRIAHTEIHQMCHVHLEIIVDDLANKKVEEKLKKMNENS